MLGSMSRSKGNRPVSMFYEARTVPAHACAMGKALLAFAPPELAAQVLAGGLDGYTPFTITDPDRLRRGLAITRLTRVAVCRREYDPATCAVASPVFGAGGDLLAALEVELHNPHELRPLQPSLVVAARVLSRELATDHVSGRLIASCRAAV